MSAERDQPTYEPPRQSPHELLAAARALLEPALASAADPAEAARALRELGAWAAQRAAELDGAPVSEPAPPAPAEEAPSEVRTLMLGGEMVQVRARRVEGVAAAAFAGAVPRRVELPRSDAARPASASPVYDDRTPAPGLPRRAVPDVGGLMRIAERSRLKVEACEAALARQRGEPVDFRPLLERARHIPTCRLWPLEARHAGADAADLELVARTWENVAHVAEIARGWEESHVSGEEVPEDLLLAGAEAQSALRVAQLALGFAPDADQVETFVWIKERAHEARVYLHHHMRVDDCADPHAWSDLRQRLEALDERLRQAREARDARAARAARVRGAVERLGGAGAEERAPARAELVSALEAWVAAGHPASSRDVCELLSEHLDDLRSGGAEVSEGAQRVVDACVKQRDARGARARAAEPAAAEPPSPEVAAARELLRGRVVLLIGGQRRRDEQARLERELELKELRWAPTRPHRSLDPLVTQISQADVDLVLLAIRWSDHAMGDLAKAAEEAGKPFVRLPAGYGTNQVAHQVLEQVSKRLAEAPPPE